MASYYFASDNTLAGRDGSINNPYRDPSELGSPWALAGGNSYYFREDCEWNFPRSFYLSAFTSSPIIVSSYGTGAGAKPIIKSYRLIDRSECVEVAITQDTPTITVTPASGTNLWLVPLKFIGLYAGRKWGPASDVTGTAGSGSPRRPQAAFEYSTQGVTTGGPGRIVYSVGNPVDVYGALYATPVSDADYAVAAKVSSIGAVQANGGLEVSGLRFATQGGSPVFFAAGNPAITIARMRNNKAIECEFVDTYGGVSMSGTGTSFNGKGFTGARIEDNYAENLGRAFVDCSFGDCCFNDFRIARNVVNGCGKSYSTGGIYIGAGYTNDGSRILVERNTISGAVAFNVWVSDGYAFYSENSTQNIEFRHNFGWNNDINFVFNVSGPELVFRQNVAYMKPGSLDSYSRMFTGSGVNAGTNALIAGNVAIGFRRFFFANAGGVSGLIRLQNNVSRCNLSSGGPSSGTNNNAIRVGGHDTSKLIVDDNNFYGHDAAVYDTSNSTDYPNPPNVTNAITTDPAAEIARIPVPTDPTVNYAMQLSPNFWSGTVNLRPGTRLLAA